jgi:hypothetical protein
MVRYWSSFANINKPVCLVQPLVGYQMNDIYSEASQRRCPDDRVSAILFSAGGSDVTRSFSLDGISNAKFQKQSIWLIASESDENHSWSQKVKARLSNAISVTKVTARQAARSVKSVFGSKAGSSQSIWLSLPCGLPNRSGDNLCFMNCILQAIARTPTFFEELGAAKSRTSISSVVIRLAELMSLLKNTFNSSGVCRQVDSAAFQYAASVQVCALLLKLWRYIIHLMHASKQI